jgi:PEP-CTERM motif
MVMNRLNVASPLFRCALGIVFLALFHAPSYASVIYEYRELGSTAVIGTLEIMAPPASTGSGWSTADSSDVIALFLDDSLFGLGPDNLLLAGGTLSVVIESLDGSKLDGGGVGITFPTIFPPSPADPTIDRTLSFAFDVPAGGDFIGLATFLTFPDGSVIIGDLFLDGDWAAVAVPEPGTFALLGMGLLAAGRSAWAPTSLIGRSNDA